MPRLAATVALAAAARARASAERRDVLPRVYDVVARAEDACDGERELCFVGVERQGADILDSHRRLERGGDLLHIGLGESDRARGGEEGGRLCGHDHSVDPHDCP
jgi:hypothetical protein